MDKLIDSVTIRYTPEQHHQLSVLAALQGITIPELLRKISTDYLSKKAHEYFLLSQAFGRNDSSEINSSTGYQCFTENPPGSESQ